MSCVLFVLCPVDIQPIQEYRGADSAVGRVKLNLSFTSEGTSTADFPGKTHLLRPFWTRVPECPRSGRRRFVADACKCVCVSLPRRVGFQDAGVRWHIVNQDDDRN